MSLSNIQYEDVTAKCMEQFKGQTLRMQESWGDIYVRPPTIRLMDPMTPMFQYVPARSSYEPDEPRQHRKEKVGLQHDRLT